MGLKLIRKEIIKRLKEGYIQHDVSRSGDINVKNLLLIGEISVHDVIELINKTKGEDFKVLPHHYIEETEVYIFTPDSWYIKCFLLEPNVVFISVHH